MKGARFLISIAAIAALAASAFAHGGGGGGGGGHGGGGHGGGSYYAPIFIYGGGGAPELPGSDTGNYDNIHTIGVLVSAGDDFETLANGQKLRNIPIPAWGVNTLIGTTLRRYLEPRFKLTDVSFDHSALNAIQRHMYRERDTLALLTTLPNPGVDAYLIVRPAYGDLPGPDGIGVDISLKGDTFLFTNFELDLIDARTLTYVAKGFAQVADQQGQPPTFAARQVPIAISSPSGAAQAAILYKEIADLLPRAIVETIRSLKMGVPLPPVGDHAISEPAFAFLFKGVHSLAVVSAIGDTFKLINPGNMFITKTDTNVPFAQAGIDDAVESQLRAVLARNYVVKQEPVDRAALANTTLIASEHIPAFSGLKATNDVDAYVIIVKATNRDSPFPGIGFAHWTPLMNRGTTLFVDYAVVLVNARTLRPMTGLTAAAPAVPPCKRADMVILTPPPLFDCAVDSSWWPENGNQLPESGVTQARALAVTMLSASLPESLYHLGLKVDAPSPALATNPHPGTTMQ